MRRPGTSRSLDTYWAEDGFSNAGIALAVVAYFVGTITALLVLGRCQSPR
ncbi:hypothetical protein [Microlunatus phosphovorus]|nr:hypothetical protein [Microlunatus phosphovorus]